MFSVNSGPGKIQGGMADDIRIFDFTTKQSQKITDHIRQDIIPMWSSDGKKSISFLTGTTL